VGFHLCSLEKYELGSGDVLILFASSFVVFIHSPLFFCRASIGLDNEIVKMEIPWKVVSFLCKHDVHF